MRQYDHTRDLIIGLGEIGRPLMSVLEETYSVIGKDIEPLELEGRVRVLHVCYPYEIGDFVEMTGQYAATFSPELIIIHSTIVPGTSRKIFERTNIPLAYSPVRGKHTRMRQDLLKYTKFVAGITPEASDFAVRYLEAAGLKVDYISKCEALELAKLTETTYFGLLIAWAQEVERYCDFLGADYDEVMAFTSEVDYLPPVVFQPGYIGGHCVIPNTHLLDQLRPSEFIEVIRYSNELKKQRWLKEGKDLNLRVRPKPVNQ